MRPIQFKYKGDVLELTDEFKSVVDQYYMKFSKKALEQILTFGFIMFTLVTLQSRHIVPQIVEHSMFDVGIYPCEKSAQQCYLVRKRKHLPDNYTSQGFGRQYFPSSYDGQNEAFDVRETTARRIDMRTYRIGTEEYDGGIFVWDGFGYDPTLDGKITSAVAMTMDDITYLNTLKTVYLEHHQKLRSFKPMVELATAKEDDFFREYLNGTNRLAAASDVGAARSQIAENMAFMQQLRTALEDGWGQVSLDPDLRQGREAPRALGPSHRHTDYQTIMGGKVSSFTPPPLPPFNEVELEQLLLRKISNVYRVPEALLRQQATTQGNVALQDEQYRRTIHEWIEKLKPVMADIFNMVELNSTTNMVMSMKFREIIRPKAISRIVRENDRTEAWNYLKVVDKTHAQLAKELTRAKAQNPKTEFRLMPTRDTLTWVPFDAEYVKTVHEGASVPVPVDNIPQLEEEEEDVKQDYRRSIPNPLGNDKDFTEEEINDIFLASIVSLSNDQLVNFYRGSTIGKRLWIDNKIAALNSYNFNNPPRIEVVYMTFGALPSREMFSLFAIGVLSPEEYWSQIRYRLNLDTDSKIASKSLKVLEGFQKFLASSEFINLTRDGGLSVIAEHLERIPEEEEAKESSGSSSKPKKKRAASSGSSDEPKSKKAKLKKTALNDKSTAMQATTK